MVNFCPEMLKFKPLAVENYCTKCKKDFSSRTNLYKHVQKNTCKFKGFKCECGKWFATQRGLTTHQKRN